MLEVTCAPYSGEYDRSAELTIYGVGVSSQKVRITQAGTYIAPTLDISTTALTFSATAGSQPFTITSNTTWKVYESLSWLSISPASGSNTGDVVVTVLPRTSTSSRSGTITIYGTGTSSKRITVKQLGVGAAGIAAEQPENFGVQPVPVVPGTRFATHALSVFPNPASSTVHVQALETLTGDIQINVLDMFGKVVEQRNLSSGWLQGATEVLDLSRLINGLYIIQVRSAANGWTTKIQVVR